MKIILRGGIGDGTILDFDECPWFYRFFPAGDARYTLYLTAGREENGMLVFREFAA